MTYSNHSTTQTQTQTQTAGLTNLPLAAPGLTSYRSRGRFGFIMIGARNHADAQKEAERSSDAANRADLEVWDKVTGRYVPATAGNEPANGDLASAGELTR